MPKNKNSDNAKFIRTNELDEIKSYSHDRPHPDSKPPTERPTMSKKSDSKHYPDSKKDSDKSGN